jgi:ketosteroid isomerase-like protein
MKRLIGSAILAAIILAGRGAVMAEPPDDLAQLQAELEAIGAKLQAAILAGDIETQLEYFTEEMVFCPDLHPPIRGREALRQAMLQDQRDGVKVLSYNATNSEIRPCGDHVFQRGHFAQSSRRPDHPQPIAISGSYATIWSRQPDGKLQIEYVIWNLDFNPWEGR